MKKRLPLYIVDLNEKEDKMLSLSIVKHPATGLPWKVLEQTEQETKVFAPILSANKPIYRNNNTYGEHYVMFTPNVIADIIADCSRRKVPFDIEHNGIPTNAVQMLESFQIDYYNGKLYKGYPGLTDGSWCAVLNLKNMVFRKNPTDGSPLDFLGISISGIFTYHPVSLAEAIEFYNKIKF